MRRIRYYEEDDPKAEKMIKDLADSYGDSNEDQGKMVQLLKGLAFSDDPEANKFMKALDKWTTQQSKKMNEAYDPRNPEEKRAYELMMKAAEDAGIKNPDSELVWWDGETLVYDGMSIYPREELRFRARQAWKEYQGYTW